MIMSDFFFVSIRFSIDLYDPGRGITHISVCRPWGSRVPYLHLIATCKQYESSFYEYSLQVAGNC